MSQTLTFAIYAGMYSGLSLATFAYSASLLLHALNTGKATLHRSIAIAKMLMCASFFVNGVCNAFVHSPLSTDLACYQYTQGAEATYRIGYTAANFVILLRVARLWKDARTSLVYKAHYFVWALYLCCATADAASIMSRVVYLPDGVGQYCSYEPISAVIYLTGALDMLFQLYSLSFSFWSLWRRRGAGQEFNSVNRFLKALVVSYTPRALVLFVTAVIDAWITASGTYGQWVLFFWITVNLILMLAVTMDDKAFAMVISDNGWQSSVAGRSAMSLRQAKMAKEPQESLPVPAAASTPNLKSKRSQSGL
ncbi:hypothetical protein RI367_007368 [Sorochytrium milnesiophthora]